MDSVNFYSIHGRRAIKTLEITKITQKILNSIDQLEFKSDKEKAFILAAAMLVQQVLDEYIVRQPEFASLGTEEPFEITPEWVEVKLRYLATLKLFQMDEHGGKLA